MSSKKEQTIEEMLQDLTIGEIVAKARRSRRLTIKRIGDDLNIRPSHLEAIEENRFSDLPGKVYITGFLRSYCDYLELDANVFIDKLRTDGHLAPETDYTLPTPVEGGMMPSAKIMAGAGVLLVILGVVFGLYYWQIGSGGERGEAKVETAPATLVTPALVEESTQKVEEGGMTPSPEFVSPDPEDEVKQNKTPEAVPDEPEQQVADRTEETPAKPLADTPKPQSAASAILARAETSSALKKKAEPKPAEPAKVEVPQEPKAVIPPAPAGARIRLVAMEEVWVQVRDTVSEKVYVSKVLKKGESHWVRPRVGTVLDVGNPPALNIFVDGKDFGASGILTRRVWALPLVPSYLTDDYFGKGLNLQPNIDTKTTESAPDAQATEPEEAGLKVDTPVQAVVDVVAAEGEAVAEVPVVVSDVPAENKTAEALEDPAPDVIKERDPPLPWAQP